MKGTETTRFDADYFQKAYIQDANLISLNKGRFRLFQDLRLAVDGSAFYPAIESYYDSGSLPFLRVADVDSVINLEQCTTIPRELCDIFPTLKLVKPGDIVLTKGGSVARVGLVTKEAAASRDLIFINSSKLPERDYTFLYLYFQTNFCNRLLIRSSSQTAQPHLTITLVRNLPLLDVSDEFKQKCLEVVQASFFARGKSLNLYTAAEQTLLTELGLRDWQPPAPLTYQRKASDVLRAGRLDVEHFHPKFEAAIEELKRKGAIHFIELGQMLFGITNGHTPLHHDFSIGEVPFLGAEHVKDFRIDYEPDRLITVEQHTGELARTRLQNGDLLITIKGRVGNTAVVEGLEKEVNINQDIARLRLTNALPHWYVAAFLNSRFGKLMIEKFSTGQINPFLGLANVRLLPIPVFDVAVMNRIAYSTHQLINDAYSSQTQAKLLLERAKRAVEIAIEESEAAALTYLDAKLSK
jgi:type I restriction enzyme S subunit